MIWPGEDEAWDLLGKCDPVTLQTAARAIFDPGSSTYVLTCFGQDIHISLKERIIAGSTPIGKYLVEELSESSRLSILRYLLDAREEPLSGKLINPADLPGGGILLQGTHVLPLAEVAHKFADSPGQFLKQGRSLAGFPAAYGDTALQLFPFPRLPVVLILWSGDEEFPPRSTLLLDASAVLHLPMDVIWAASAMILRMMLCDLPGV